MHLGGACEIFHKLNYDTDMPKNLEIEPSDARHLPFVLVAPELEKVEASLRDQVRHFDPGVEPYMSYICNTAGKRIRPALAILVGGATGGVHADHLKLGTILELIHMATLVHDDIIDGATTRRKVPTTNSKWGEGMAVLLGDALFSHALMLSTEFDAPVLSRAIAAASRDVCQGEILQTQRRFDLTLTKEEYFRVIEMKTGALFAAATDLSAYLSQVPDDTRAAMNEFGMKLGTAYQIYDDCLDLVGTEEQFGKTLRTDLEKGKLTLPMLYLLEDAGETQRPESAEAHHPAGRGRPHGPGRNCGIRRRHQTRPQLRRRIPQGRRTLSPAPQALPLPRGIARHPQVSRRTPQIAAKLGDDCIRTQAVQAKVRSRRDLTGIETRLIFRQAALENSGRALAQRPVVTS